MFILKRLCRNRISKSLMICAPHTRSARARMFLSSFLSGWIASGRLSSTFRHMCWRHLLGVVLSVYSSCGYVSIYVCMCLFRRLLEVRIVSTSGAGLRRSSSLPSSPDTRIMFKAPLLSTYSRSECFFFLISKVTREYSYLCRYIPIYGITLSPRYIHGKSYITFCHIKEWGAFRGQFNPWTPLSRPERALATGQVAGGG